MRCFLLLALLGAGTISFALANPIAIDLGPPIALIAESVNISVREGQSVVSGTYSFRRTEDDWPYQPDDGVTIQVPIIGHGPQTFRSLKSSTAVSLTLGRKVFYPSRVSVDSPLYDLPSGWKLYYLEFSVPHRALRPVFTVSIRYLQPHLPGDISPYYPIHPPERWAPNSAVRYSVAKPASITLVSKGESVFEVQPTRISVQPEHHKLILVRINASGR